MIAEPEFVVDKKSHASAVEGSSVLRGNKRGENSGPKAANCQSYGPGADHNGCSYQVTQLCTSGKPHGEEEEWLAQARFARAEQGKARLPP